MTRVLVCGGRHYGLVKRNTPKNEREAAEARALRQRARLAEILDAAVVRLGLTNIIQGGQTGADTLAREWAEARNIPNQTFEADWAYGKTAGPIRNTRMLKEGQPDVVIAFPGNWGTDDMVDKARAAGVRVIRI